jgi:hypothetical protein
VLTFKYCLVAPFENGLLRPVNKVRLCNEWSNDMQKIMKFAQVCLLQVCGFSQILMAQETPVTVAVIDLYAPDLAPSAAVTLSNIVREELLKSDIYFVVDRNNMESLLQEQGLQSSGVCSDLACIVQVGKILGVQKMVGGSIGKLGSKFILQLQTIDVESSKIERMEKEEYSGTLEALDGVIRSVAARLAGAANAQNHTSFLQVSAQPAGADIYLDGGYQGKAPLLIKMDPDKSHLVRVEMDGYASWQQSVIARADQTLNVAPILSRSLAVLPQSAQPADQAAYNKHKKSPAAALRLSLLLPPAGHVYVGGTSGILHGLFWTGALTFFALNVETKTETLVQTGVFPNLTTRVETGTEINSQYATTFVVMYLASFVDAMLLAKRHNEQLKKKYGLSWKMSPSPQHHSIELALLYKI